MADSTGPVLAMGTITLVNTWFFNDQKFDAKIPIATGIAAGMFALIEHADRNLAVGLAWLSLATVLFVPLEKNVQPPAVTLLAWFNGYKNPK